MPHVPTHVLVAIFAFASIGIASAIAWSHFAVSAGDPAYVTKDDFDQTFTNATVGHRESNVVIRKNADGTARSSGGATTNVNRARKSDSPGLAKGTNGTPVRHNSFDIDDAMPTAKPTHARYCEPVASPFADPALARIMGRCFV